MYTYIYIYIYIYFSLSIYIYIYIYTHIFSDHAASFSLGWHRKGEGPIHMIKQFPRRDSKPKKRLQDN